MMTEVYLQKLKLKGFRSYKSETEVTFAAGPGLTVIVGPNGLGKSTLFDAVEWGLTGELRRLNGMDAKTAEKKAALGKKPEVQLWFSDAAHIYRTLTKEVISNSDISNIQDWLTAGKWRGATSISDCLQLTHFLGQSSRQMFVHLDGKKRWGLLEGPAGLQSLWKVEGSLGRKQTDLGFDRVEEDLLREEKSAGDNLARIEAVREQLRSKRDLERADEILPPAEVLSRCQRIGDELTSELPAAVIGQEFTGEQRADIDAVLQKQRMNLESAVQQLAQQRAGLRQWRSLAQAYFTSIAKKTSLRADKERAAHESSAAETEVLTALSTCTLARTEHQSLVDQSLIQQSARDAVLAELSRNQKSLLANEKLQAQRIRLNDLTAKQNEQGKLIAAQKELLEKIELRRTRHAELIERGASLKVLSDQADGLSRGAGIHQSARLELVSVPVTEAELRVSLDEHRQSLTSLEASANELKLQKDAAVAVSNAISASVAQIASSLRDDECVCPVCRTTFEIAGELKNLAKQQANVEDRKLAEIEQKISQQASKIIAAQQTIFDLRTRITQLQERREELTRLIRAADLLEHTLRASPILSRINISEFEPALAAASNQNNEELKDLILALAASPDAISVRGDIERFCDAKRNIVTEVEQTCADLIRLERELDQLRNLPTSGLTAEQLQAALLESETVLRKSSQSLLESQSKLDAAKVAHAVLEAGMVEKKKALNETEAELATMHQTEKDFVERWTREGYADTPLPITVQQVDESHVNRDLCLQRLVDEHSVLLNGHRRYLAHVELQQLESSLKAECEKHQVLDIDSVISKITTHLAGVRNRIDVLSTVRQKRADLLSQFKQKATAIRSTVSEPLNANTEKFCAALMSDRTHQVSLSAIASATTAQALLSFYPDGKDEPKNPLLYMSEGQLAATSLCLLFGASATYPWSRWKSLLMDDPLHHNDSIHTAAFIDVVRNLIRCQGYQIIVSTHDMDQAGFFLRKCRNAGISAQYIHLYGRAKDGTALLHTG